jgi:hypothetical protein
MSYRTTRCLGRSIKIASSWTIGIVVQTHAPTRVMASESAASVTAPPTTSSSSIAVDSMREQPEARAAVLASLNSVGASYSHALQSRAIDLHSNATAIGTQEAQLAKSMQGLEKESARLAKEVDKTTKVMKEVGDLQNWAEMLERDFMVLEETVRLAEGGGEVQRESGGSTWR